MARHVLTKEDSIKGGANSKRPTVKTLEWRERLEELESKVNCIQGSRYEYYVYEHLNIHTKEVFYVGKGIDRRYKSTDRSNKWLNYVKCNGGEFYTRIVYSNLLEKEALAIEARLIRAYGNQLVNVYYNTETVYFDEDTEKVCL